MEIFQIGIPKYRCHLMSQNYPQFTTKQHIKQVPLMLPKLLLSPQPIYLTKSKLKQKKNQCDYTFISNESITV